MRVTVLSVGSRGDVHPLIGFARALAAAGHEVRFAAFPKFERDVAANELEFAPLAEGRLGRGTRADAAEDEDGAGRGGRRGAGRGRGVPMPLRFLQDSRSVGRERLADALGAGEGADALVANELATLLAWQVAEQRGVPLVRVRYSPPPAIAGRPVAGAARQLGWLAVRPWLGSGRRELGLPALPLREPLGRLDARRTLELYAYSPAVGPEPARKGPWTHVTGYWFLDGALDPEPPRRLLEFLADGAAPVCIGFGSMLDDGAASTARATRELVLEALERAGQRGVLLGGLSAAAASELPASAIAVDSVAHDRLFERCAAVVHHGGAGTVAAALRAGVPSVIVPHMIDQHGWGRRVHQLGAAPAPIPRRKLSAERLAEAISAAAGDASMRERAGELAQRIREEDGISRAVEVFERHMGRAVAHAATEVINS
ncbi:MAG TPA: glycosyltransferase [Solirubrobacteraceae bacterium]|nr:glycosyltransferase [Solirubrobacteraceae bacterium]